MLCVTCKHKSLAFLRVVSAIFYQIFIFYQMIALQKLWKMFLISSKKPFSLSRYSNFCISVFPSVYPCQLLLWRLIQHQHDIISCLNKNLITHWKFAHWWNIKWKTFLWENHAEYVHQKLVPDPFLILVNNPKQPLHARNSFKNKIFWKRIIKQPWKS